MVGYFGSRLSSNWRLVSLPFGARIPGMIEPPKSSDDPLDRTQDCKNALRTEVLQLADQALEAGWHRYEVALALSDLGEQFLQTPAESAESEADIAIGRALFEIKRALDI